MTNEQKQQIYQILTDQNTSIQEKYDLILAIFPNYLTTVEQKKAIYEKIEWMFHDWLWTYFELLVYDKINEYYQLNQQQSNKDIAIQKIENGKNLYTKFFANNEYNVNLENEIENIKSWSNKALILISEIIWTQTITRVSSSAQEFRQGNARDVFVDLTNWEQLNFSLKTDKSGKVALFEWQTGDIQEKVYKRYFNLTDQEYLDLKQELFNTTDDSIIREQFDNIAQLTQKVFIKQFWLENADINNLWSASITNIENIKYFIRQLKRYKNSDDGSIVIGINRLNWNIINNTILDDINVNDLRIRDFSFLPCKPKKYRYWTEPWVKYACKTFVSFQIKHKRWKNPSHKFSDITIRLKTK